MTTFSEAAKIAVANHAVANAAELEAAKKISALVEEYAQVEAAYKALGKKLDNLKEAVKATGREELVGVGFVLKVSLYEQTRFDGATAKTFLTADQIKLCEKSLDCYRISVKARPSAEKIAQIVNAA